MAGHKFLTVLVSCITLSAVVGCGPRRTTTVDPPLDPAFRSVPGPIGRAYPKEQPNLTYPGGRTSSSANEPWVVSNRSNRWTYIIVHHSATQAGGAQRFDRAHRNNGWDELGYHFVIGNGTDTADGQIEVGSRWSKQKHGAHCRVSPTDSNEYNEHGIGICLVGNFDYAPPTRAQMNSLIYLTRGLLAYTHMSASAVHFHRDFDSTECPGRYFPYAAYKRALRN